MIKLFYKLSSKLVLSISETKSLCQTTSVRYKSKVCSSGSKTAKGPIEKVKPEKSSKDGQVQKDQTVKKDETVNKSERSNIPRIGINGFGRIGRMAMRIAVEHECPIEIVAINNPMMTAEYMAYSLKYDSTHGQFIGELEVRDGQLIVDGKCVCTYGEFDPGSIPWADLGVEYVIESSGKFTTVKAASGHLSSGARKVVVTAPSKDAPMYVMGVNLDSYDPSEHVVSNASCATNALAPLAKVVHDNFGLEEGLMSTVHATTASQKVIDSPSLKNWREGRGAMQNIIPTYTGASVALSKVLPALKGRLNAISIRVPTANVSLVDLTCRLAKDASIEDIKLALCEASEGPLMGILDVVTEEVVSSDFNGSTYSCIFDTNASMALNKKFVKLIAWFDNEYGYTCRVIDLIKFMHAEKSSE